MRIIGSAPPVQWLVSGAARSHLSPSVFARSRCGMFYHTSSSSFAGRSVTGNGDHIARPLGCGVAMLITAGIFSTVRGSQCEKSKLDPVPIDPSNLALGSFALLRHVVDFLTKTTESWPQIPVDAAIVGMSIVFDQRASELRDKSREHEKLGLQSVSKEKLLDLSEALKLACLAYNTDEGDLKRRLEGRGGGWLCLQTTLDSQPGKPAHFVALEHPGMHSKKFSGFSKVLPSKLQESIEGKKQAYFVIRGTDEIADVVTDVVLTPTPFLGGYVHLGIERSARHLLQEKERLLRMLIADGYSIVTVGHSLGAGVASIAAMIIKEQYPDADVTCYGFATPAVADEFVAHTCKEFVTTVVCDDDIIPRSSLANVQKLTHELTGVFCSGEAADTIKEYLSAKVTHAPTLDYCCRWVDAYTSKVCTSITAKGQKNVTGTGGTANQVELVPPGDIIHLYRAPMTAQQPSSSALPNSPSEVAGYMKAALDKVSFFESPFAGSYDGDALFESARQKWAKLTNAQDRDSGDVRDTGRKGKGGNAEVGKAVEQTMKEQAMAQWRRVMQKSGLRSFGDADKIVGDENEQHKQEQEEEERWLAREKEQLDKTTRFKAARVPTSVLGRIELSQTMVEDHKSWSYVQAMKELLPGLNLEDFYEKDKKLKEKGNEFLKK